VIRNPLNTLAGRMVLVTVIAVAISYAIAFAFFTNERGNALRRAAESAFSERVAFTADRLSQAPAERRAMIAEGIRDPSIRFRVESEAATTETAGGAASRISRAIGEQFVSSEVHVTSRVIETESRRWRNFRERMRDRDERTTDERRHDREMRRRHNEHTPLVRLTEVHASVRLDDTTWLNARGHLPGPAPAPWPVLIGALVSVIAVGIGAALISRQIGRPLSDLANAARALGSGQGNITARVSGPEDVRRASTAFNAMAERLGRQLNRQREMLWALSHDLRTPITALRLRAELIEDDAARQRLLAPIEEMERLTEQALSLARAGASEEARVNVDLAEIVRTLCGELQDMGVNVSADANAPVNAECRPSEIARALRNLAENAAKYAGSGVMRAYRGPAGEAVVEIVDNGPGVPADQIAKLAAPFFRADSARSEANGAGLGLAIAQAIAEAHGGKLELANRTPRGFSARLVLPG